MQSQLPLGCFVTVQNCDLGIGKLVEQDGSNAKVEWFTSISQHISQPDIREYDRKLVRHAWPSKQTRCYLTDEYELTWEMGRIQQTDRTYGTTGLDYEVHLPGNRGGYYPEECIYVRCLMPSVDPIDTLICRAQETPFFYHQRAKFLDSIIQQRATAHGLTGLISSQINLYPHQVEVVRRVLEDPVQRYLLADEVGLGKTIEAGCILRQIWLDDPSSRALVVVPKELEVQWRLELEDKFDLNTDGGFITLCTTDNINKLNSKEPYDIVVIEEAHHIASASHQPENAFLWENCCRLAHSAPRLLLLSATPALHREQDFLAMLHLLEKETYRFDDIEAFEKLVRDRQPIGELLLLFREVREDIERAPLRWCLDTLRELSDADEWALVQVDKLQDLCSAEKFDKNEANQIIRVLRVHICETYRLYRRMLRNSRESVSSILKDVLSPRATRSDFPPITKELGYDERLDALSQCLEDWRATATDVMWLTEETSRDAVREDLTKVFLILLQCSGTWLQVLNWAVDCRLSGAVESTQYFERLGKEFTQILVNVPMFEAEEVILRKISRTLSFDSEEQDQIDCLRDVINLVNDVHPQSSAKCVVFTWNTMAGREIVRRLHKAMGINRVISHLRGDSQESLREGVEKFRDTDRPVVIVCDQSGEEGLNLQFADVLIHFDLPWDPNRLEQRIGRFDRIGRHNEVRQWTFVASSDDDIESLHDAWYRMLRDGLCIFSQSIADLQFFTDKSMPLLKQHAFMNGTQGLIQQLEVVKKGIEEERKLLREQTALDEIEAFDQDDINFFLNLVEYDSRTQEIKYAVEGWVVDTLRMKPDFQFGDKGYDPQESSSCHKFVRYMVADYTLVPTEWSRQLVTLQTGFASYSRREACNAANIALLRIGHPFIDCLRDYINWDDRGQAFALWRCIPQEEPEYNQVVLQLDYIVDTDLDHLRDLLCKSHWDSRAEYALSRQADAWFPPQRRVMFVDTDLNIISDQEILMFIKKPYRKDLYDFNLRADRQCALDEIISPDRWIEVCRNIRSYSENTIRGDSRFKDYCQAGVERARQNLTRRMDQLQRGLVYRKELDIDITNISDINLIIDEERQLYEAIILGIERPRVKLDAVGVIVLSTRNPFTIED